MALTLTAACLCSTGKVRKKNEDNFFFNGKCLEEDNDGLKQAFLMEQKLHREVSVAVFDGMGGMNFGEAASFAAARCMRDTPRRLKDYFVSKEKLLNELCAKMNEAVLEKKRALCTEYMGTTVVMFCFTSGSVWVCNIGDSRAYRLRGSEFLQLSKDHVEKLRAGSKSKAPLTQHLGISPEDFLIEPYIAESGLRRGDQYLLCSDGVTDMLTEDEITEIMKKSETPEICAERLVDAALENGGRDNITAIVCRID